VVRLQSEPSAEDPRPEVPRLFLDRPWVHKLVSQLHRQRQAVPDEKEDEPNIGKMLAAEKLVENAADSPVSSESTETSQCCCSRPQRSVRTCVATLQGADACGRIFAAEAASRGFDQAPRKGFLGDGQALQLEGLGASFKGQGYIPIADFIHLLSYVYSLAMAVGRRADEGWQLHTQWITAPWNGRAT